MLVVHWMQREDFLSVEKLQRIVDKDTTKVFWMRTRVTKLEKQKPFSNFFIEEFDGDSTYSEIFVSRSVRGHLSVILTANYLLHYQKSVITVL